MKRFNFKTLIIPALMVFLISPVFAQNIGSDFKDKTPEERAKFQTDLMKSKLGLNAGQLVKAQELNLRYAKQFQPILKSSDSKFTRLKQAMDLQKKKDLELKKIFTDEQFKQYESIESELRGKLKGKVK